MKKTVCILITLAALILTACVKEETDNNGYNAEVTFTGNLTGILTRVSGTEGTNWDANDSVGIYMLPADPGTLTAGNILAGNKRYNAAAGTTSTFSPNNGTPLYYPTDGSGVKFVAYYPFTASVGSHFTVPVNVANQSNLPAIDVLYAPVTATSNHTASTPVALQFAHKLSKLVFRISNGEGVTEPVANGITASISHQLAAATLNLSDGTVTPTSTTFTTITATGGATVEAIVLPAADLTDVAFLFTNDAGQCFTVSAPAGNWQGGYQYTYTVTLKAADAQADISASISRWNDGGNKDINGGETADAVIRITLNPAGLTRAAGGTARLWIAGIGDAVINWGDGQTNTYPLTGTATYYDHTYADGTDYVTTIAGILTYLDCKGNQISSLDVSASPTLTFLNCSGNMLTTLDLSGNPLLEDVKFANNQFEGLSLKGNTTITHLNLDNVKMDTLDMSGCSSLRSLESRNSGLKEVNVSGCTSLEVLNLYNNKLDSLDVAECTKLKELVTWGSPLTNLDLSHNPALTTLYVHSGKLTELDVTRNPELKELYCRNNLLTTLDVSHNPKLERISCGSNQLTALNISNNPLLVGLYFENNNISAINLSTAPLLEELLCSGTGLFSLELNDHEYLELLLCQENRLEGTLDLSHCIRLREVNVSDNQLYTIQASGLLNLWTLTCKNNNMPYDGLLSLFDSLHSRLGDNEMGNYVLENAFPTGEEEDAVAYAYDTNKTVDVSGNPGPMDDVASAESKGWTVIR